jgi:DNA helicase-2/ATP-dependent DNA helicase PcrA
MNAVADDSPALAAAREAEARVLQCLKARKHFLLEAGAGAGKTYSLTEALRYLIAKEGKNLKRANQRIACITYTNAATAVINSRIDGNRLVYTDTVHAFCWFLIKGFQAMLRTRIAALPAWTERIVAFGGIGTQRVEYDLGHRSINADTLTLHHDDVLTMAVQLLPEQKFQTIIAAKFPFILIDEYQDTNAEVMNALKATLLARDKGPLIGLFGDHWQRIYEKTCGHVADARLNEIGKKANFRSATAVVRVLNQMRPALPQAVKDEAFVGSAKVFHTNTWVGQRRPAAGGGHWTGDLPADEAHRHLLAFMAKLKAEDGWDFAPGKTKVLMLTHNVLASEQGYAALAKVFPYTDQFIKKEDDHISFFADKLEPACEAYRSKRYGEMFSVLAESSPRPSSHADKVRWSAHMDALLELRLTGTVGAVLDFIRDGTFIRLPETVARREDEALAFQAEAGAEMPERVSRVRKLRGIPYAEVIALDQFIDGHTPFATKHSVKGDEFENVLIVLGRGWNHYNFNQFLEFAAADAVIPADRQTFFERNRNLFYVACSRPTTRLALFFTQQLSDAALATLRAWFGADAVAAFASPAA